MTLKFKFKKKGRNNWWKHY